METEPSSLPQLTPEAEQKVDSFLDELFSIVIPGIRAAVKETVAKGEDINIGSARKLFNRSMGHIKKQTGIELPNPDKKLELPDGTND